MCKLCVLLNTRTSTLRNVSCYFVHPFPVYKTWNTHVLERYGHALHLYALHMVRYLSSLENISHAFCVGPTSIGQWLLPISFSIPSIENVTFSLPLMTPASVSIASASANAEISQVKYLSLCRVFRQATLAFKFPCSK